ncbi:MAG TPA: alpha/beta hydrolase [Acidimicrobiales bacterium]|nr:alpha/beta hydrolase [Acidimicrobiales bacterium]
MVELSAQRILRSARRAVTDPRLTGVARALPRTAAVLNRARSPLGPEGIPVTPVTAGLAAQVMLDEILISVMRDPKLLPHGRDYEDAAAAIREARSLWEANGWLTFPGNYHREPPVPSGVSLTREKALDIRYEHLTFPSRYEPPEGVPGRDTWLSHSENATAHAWVLRHADPSTPWLVCLHGFGMGRPAMDLRGFRATHLHWDLGVNLAFVVLPLHGPRQKPGAHRGEGFMSLNLVDSVHGLAQAVWDTRSVIRWIRSTSRPDVPIGVHGVSLGGLTSALVASAEDGLACAIAGIPVSNLPDLYRRHSPPHVRRRAAAAAVLGPDADAVHSVVSPLVLEPKVERERRFIFAGVGDRMSTAGQARRLWEHWDRPRIEWYPGGHIGFFMAGGVQRFVDKALIDSGLVRTEATAALPLSPPETPPASQASGAL